MRNLLKRIHDFFIRERVIVKEVVRVEYASGAYLYKRHSCLGRFATLDEAEAYFIKAFKLRPKELDRNYLKFEDGKLFVDDGYIGALEDKEYDLRRCKNLKENYVHVGNLKDGETLDGFLIRRYGISKKGLRIRDYLYNEYRGKVYFYKKDYGKMIKDGIITQ